MSSFHKIAVLVAMVTLMVSWVAQETAATPLAPYPAGLEERARQVHNDVISNTMRRKLWVPIYIKEIISNRTGSRRWCPCQRQCSEGSPCTCQPQLLLQWFMILLMLCIDCTRSAWWRHCGFDLSWTTPYSHDVNASKKIHFIVTIVTCLYLADVSHNKLS